MAPINATDVPKDVINAVVDAFLANATYEGEAYSGCSNVTAVAMQACAQVRGPAGSGCYAPAPKRGTC